MQERKRAGGMEEGKERKEGNTSPFASKNSQVLPLMTPFVFGQSGQNTSGI